MVRYVNAWRPRDHVGEHEITATGWLPFSKRVSFFKICHLFKVKLGRAPGYLSEDFRTTRSVHSYSTRGSDFNFFADATKFPPGTFHYSAVREWNALPSSLKLKQTLPSFKRDLKRHFLTQSDS